MWFLYDSDGTRVGFTYNGAAYYYTKNAQDDITGIVDKNCNTVVEYTYDAWVKVLNMTDSSGDAHIGQKNPFLYRGYYYDSEIGLYYLNSRYYDPQTGRFLNADTTDTLTSIMDDISDKNVFDYCHNNPVIRADHDGAFWQFALAGGGSIGLSGGTFGASILAGIGAITPVGWVVIGTTVVVIVVSVYYSKKSIRNPDPYARPDQKNKAVK
jgi:RHS repeat-associated protein